MFFKPIYINLILLGSLIVCTSCESFKKKSNKIPTDTPQISSNNEIIAKIGDLQSLQVDLSPSQKPVLAGIGSILVHIKNAPPLSRFECDLSGQPIDDCVDGAIIKTPSLSGEFQLKVFAFVEANMVAQGISEVFRVEDAKNKNLNNDPIKDAESPLSIKIMSIKQDNAELMDSDKRVILKKPLKTDFAFQIKDPKSCTSEILVFCRLGNSSGLNPWTLCNSNQSLSLSPESLTLGHQNIEIEARCADIIGPRLGLSFDAVPGDYEPLKLTYLNDASNLYFLFPVREADCDLDDRRFECRASGGDFSRCQHANLLKDVKELTDVRMVCLDKIGPVLTIRPTK